MATVVCVLRGRGMARARNVPQGYAGFFNGGGGVQAAVVWYGSGKRCAVGVCDGNGGEA